MKVLLTIGLLVLAALAIPSASAALPVQCTYGPTSPGGDTHCEGSVAKCDVLVHSYDQEDALNHYKAACGCVAYDNYGRPALRLCDLLGPMAPTPTAAAAPDLFETHCVADDMGVAHCSTTLLGTCSYTTVGGASSSLACWHTAFGYCSVSPTQNPPNLWCENIQPGDGSAAAAADPTQICTAGFAQTWCDATVGPCDLRVTPWTAWGDQYVVSDCRTGGAGPTCHTEVHTAGPLAHEHWCAF